MIEKVQWPKVAKQHSRKHPACHLLPLETCAYPASPSRKTGSPVFPPPVGRHHPELPPEAGESACHRERRCSACACPSACCAPSLKTRNILREGSLASRPGPPLRCGWGYAPALTLAPPQWLRGERREPRQNHRGPAAHAAEQPRSASFHSPSPGGSPGEPRCAFPGSYAGRTHHSKGAVQ